jgi:hypothetical protein
MSIKKIIYNIIIIFINYLNKYPIIILIWDIIIAKELVFLFLTYIVY